MAIRKLTTEIKPLTQQLARTFADMTPLKGERRIKASRLKFIEDLLHKKVFLGCDWAACTVGDDALTVYRGDGQHTSHILARLSEDQFPQGLTANITRYHLDNDDVDAGVFFDLFNNPASTRSADDRMRQIVANWPELYALDIPEPFLTKVAKIIQAYRKDSNENDNEQSWLQVFPARERGLYFADAKNREFARWCYQWHEANNVRLLTKTDNELLVDMYVEWQDNEPLATALWGEVFRGDNADLKATPNQIIEMLRAAHPKTLQKKRFVDKTRKAIRELWEEYVAAENAVTA